MQGAQESGYGPQIVGWAQAVGTPSICAHPTPTAASTHFRDPCPGHGCRNHHPGQTLGQDAGGLVTVTTLTTHRQKLLLPAKSAVYKAFPEGLPARKTRGAVGTAWAHTSGPTRGHEDRSGAELPAQA